MKKQNKIGEAIKTGLAAAIEKAWTAFEDPENQKRMMAMDDQSKRNSEQREVYARIKKLRAWGVPKISAQLIARNKLATTAATEAVSIHALITVLAGNTGCGKSVAAASMIERRETGCFVRAAELVELGNHFSDRDLLSKYRRCGVLVIDDLGIEYRSEQMICRLDELLDSRAANGLPTLVTTNLTADEFRARYEERIWSRIHEFGDYHELDDPDLRVTPIGTGKRC